MVHAKDYGKVTLLENYLKLSSSVFFLLWVWGLDLSASVGLEIKKSNYKVTKEYLKLHKKFSDELCRGDYKKYDELLKEFRGTGYFIPVINDERLDIRAVKEGLPLVKQKLAWLKEVNTLLKNIRSAKEEIKTLEKLRKDFEKYKEIKSKIFYNPKAKSQYLKEGKVLLADFTKTYNDFVASIFYLMPFAYPVDHLVMRRNYDFFKDKPDELSQRRKNSTFFKRQVVEDGAQDPKTRRTDKFLRTLINTLGIQIKKQGPVITEDFRYDFEYFLERIEKSLKKNLSYHRRAMSDWEDRTQKTLDFYNDLIATKNRKKVKEQIHKKSVDKFNIKDFTLKKQADVYDFWSKQPELMQALFSLETILFNEVGTIDGKEALERKDVVQVVLNRLKIPFYRSLSAEDSLTPYLSKISEELVRKSNWLNVLLKEGEFSFTYYFISASKNIYCPDMSRRGKYIRKKNVEIILNKLKEPDFDFRAIRYFSRASMVGRIDMSSIWSDYQAIAERPGPERGLQKRLKRLFYGKKFEFLYEFTDPIGEKFSVLKIGDRVYSYHPKSNKFFAYRNPHYFTYFQPK